MGPRPPFLEILVRIFAVVLWLPSSLEQVVESGFLQTQQRLPAEHALLFTGL